MTPVKTLTDPNPKQPRFAVSLVCSALLSLPMLWSSAVNAADLAEVYEQARQYDAEYSAARYDLEAARQVIPIARSTLLPQLTFGGEAGLSTLADDGESSYGETGLSLSLRQTLFNRTYGKTLDQAEISVMQAEAQYAALGQALILRVATAYFEVLRSQAILEFSQSELEAISRQLEQAERRFDVGLVPITDVRSAQAQHDLAVAQEIAASNQLSTAREALVLISGVDTESLALLADDLPLLPPEPADIDAWVDHDCSIRRREQQDSDRHRTRRPLSDTGPGGNCRLQHDRAGTAQRYGCGADPVAIEHSHHHRRAYQRPGGSGTRSGSVLR